MAGRSLDIGYRQCLVDFFEDADGFRWHMRVLIFPSQNGDGKWIGVTPDHSVQVLDLNQHRVVPLARASELPANLLNEIYAFDEFEDGALDDIVRQARDLAEMMGYVKPSVVDPKTTGRWRVADPASDLFGELVPDPALADTDLCVTRDAHGLVRIDQVWYAMERVVENEFETWKEKKANGRKGVDRRILPVRRDGSGRVILSETEAVTQWKELSETDFPLKGPRMAKEYFGSLRAVGQTLLQHHMDFVRKSGVPDRGGVAREHYALVETLRLFVTHDQLDGSTCVGIEMLCRRLFALEQAVARNPKAPDWDGLDIIQSAVVSDTGGVAAPKFSAWVSSQQQADAQIMKQGRLLREERAAETKRRAGKNGAPEP